MRWWQRLIRRQQLETQADRELQFHLAEREAELIARGQNPREARRQARLELGGVEQVKEQIRDARGTRWVDDLVQDVRYALRGLRRKPGFAAGVICTLALGGGATTIIFTVANGVLLRPLPYPQPHQLVSVQEQTDWSTALGNLWAFAYPNYLDCKRDVRALQLAAWRFSGGTVSGQGDAQYVSGRQISADLFSVLGVEVATGRAFLSTEDQPGGSPVVILGHGLWQRFYGGSPSAIGGTLTFDGTPYTVVGVMPAGFRLAGDADLFTPIGQSAQPNMKNREAHPGIRVWARVKPGATLEEAQTELTLIARRLAAEYPVSNKGRSFIVEPLRPFVGDAGSTLWLLLGAVSLVLVIACANIASLLLARAVSRDREMAMRAALGARRSRLIRQCLTESAVMGLLGGAIGVLIATIGVGRFVAFWPGSLPRAEEVQIDWRVLLFAFGLSLFSGILFGLAPALRAPARDLERTLRAGSWTVARSSRKLHASFVMSQIAMAVVLLVCAGMLGRAMLRLSSLDPGVDVRNVLVTRMALSPAVLGNPTAIRAAWDDVLERARRVPGVKAIAMVDTVPMREGNNQLTYWTSAAMPDPEQRPTALATSVTPDYLEVMGLPLRRGRFFDDRDRLDSEPVIVIDDVLARQTFGDEDPIGKHLWFQGLGGPVLIVGVVGHVRHWGLASDDQARVRAQMYYPIAQVPDQLMRRWSELMSIAVRTDGSPMNFLETLRQELRGMAGDQVLYQIRTLDQLANDTLARQRFLLLLFGLFAGIALLLACIGVYGVQAYLTSQRVPEFGVRMALGASATDVMRLVLGDSLWMILVGIVVGTIGAIGAGRVLSGLVDGVRPTEVSTVALVLSMLVTAALLASFVPARRASLVDTVAALRRE
jgi:predicted permease